MLTTTDVMAAKIAVQLGVVGPDDARGELRALNGTPDGTPDFVNRITQRFRIAAPVVQTIRHRVALYEHVRAEAVYLRLVEKDREVPKESVAKLLAQLESSSQRRRIGEVLVKNNRLRAEEDKVLARRARASIERDDGKILERYVAENEATILLASHNMGEVERMASLVLMMKAGKLVDRGTAAELLAKYGRDNLEEVFLDIARDRRKAQTETVG